MMSSWLGKRLKKLLDDRQEVELVGEARNGRSGVELIQSVAPDLVFLDIQMPDLDGFWGHQSIK